MDGSELKYWVGLSMVPGIGPRRFLGLLRELGSARRAYLASRGELMGLPGLGARVAEALVRARRALDLDAELAELRAAGVVPVPMYSGLYPPLLKQIHDPPPVLYVRGSLPRGGEPAVAVVGTRRATPYGLEAAAALAGALASAGVTVVSGLARGIDSAAHSGALRRGGRTIAVLAGGVDRVYPPENGGLAREIELRGALVSEFPPGSPIERGGFPSRNRIISGLCLGTVVVEAGTRSGALITADLALEQGREVFAVPGPVSSPLSAGPHELIKQGAKLAAGLNDILEELPGVELRAAVCRAADPRDAVPQAAGRDDGRPAEPGPAPGGGDEAAVYRALLGGPRAVEDLVREVGLTAARVRSALVRLEVDGLVAAYPGGIYGARLDRSRK